MKLAGSAASTALTGSAPLRVGVGNSTPSSECEAETCAAVANLRYVSDAAPGIRRARRGKSFCYFDAAGRLVRDPVELRRFRALAIPPAWADVWICADPAGHIQATGRDAKGRKQYRYHPSWRSVRDATKYGRMVAFGESLCRIRQRCARDLALPGLPRNKVLATVVELLQTTLIRVGNEEYARENGSFGLTTMRNRHVELDGANIEFKFRGKSGKRHSVALRDRRLAGVVKRCRDLPGHELFQYIDESGSRQSIDSADVNDYLRELSGESFTAKEFRTWAGTVLTFATLRDFGPADDPGAAKHNITRAIERVAERLGNTPAVCRNCYVHPAVLDAYLEGSLGEGETTGASALKHSADGRLLPDEMAVLTLLRRMAS